MHECLPTHGSAEDRKAIIVVNQKGSSVSQDTGRDAQYLANKFGMLAIAVDRPGSGHARPSPTINRRLTDDYASAFRPTLHAVANRMKPYNIESVAVMGRSAGALGVLAVAANYILPVDAVYGAEGIGWTTMSVRQGIRDFMRRNKQQHDLLKADRASSQSAFVHPHGTGLSRRDNLRRLVSHLVSEVADDYNSKNIWASDVGTRYLRQLSADRNKPTGNTRSPELYLDFAEFSLTDQTVIDTTIRQAAPHAHIEVVKGPLHTVHASFDNRAFFAERAARAIEHLQ